MIKRLQKFIKEYRLYLIALKIIKLSRKRRAIEEDKVAWLGVGGTDVKEYVKKESDLGEKLDRLWKELAKGCE